MREVKFVVIADDGYYADKGSCENVDCLELTEMHQFSYCSIMELGEYLAKYPDGVEQIEHA
jgi:hypothetical protein